MSVVTAPRVLLVEDTMSTATDYLRLLQQRGFTTDHAVTARDAIEKAAAFHPDVVLLDLQIPSAPGISDENVEHGLQTLDALLKADPFRPICVVTAHSHRELVRRAMERTHGGPFIFKDDPDIRRAIPRAVEIALASPAYTMSRVVREFRALVERGDSEENVYRRFIHQHWRVILGPEYKSCESPHTIDGGASVDLLAVRWDDFADLWELKLPSDPLFGKYGDQWLHHSAKCAEAIGQLMHYYDLAEKKTPHRFSYQARHGLSAQIHRPRGFVVIGRYGDNPAYRERLRLENSFLAGLTVLTYDDLIERAEQFLLFLQSYRNGDRPA